MAETTKTITMNELITGLGDIQATVEGKEKEICQAAVNILFALSEEGARTAEEALDILRDYRLQSKQYADFRRKHTVAGRPLAKDGVWHCPWRTTQVRTGLGRVKAAAMWLRRHGR